MFSIHGTKNAMQTTEYLDGNLSLSLQSFLTEVKKQHLVIHCTLI